MKFNLIYIPNKYQPPVFKAENTQRFKFFSRLWKLACIFLIYLLCKPTYALKSVGVFYGENVPTMQLCTNEILIISPYANFKPTDCSAIAEVIAYVSVGEIAKNAPYATDIPKQWILGKNIAWNHNFIVDQTNQDWQTYFLDKLIEPLWQQGYRGFFLDTLDSFFLVAKNNQEEQQQISGLVNLIKQIKTRHPDAKIILNRGFQLLPELHDDIYAVAIESLYHAWNQEKNRYELTKSSDRKILFSEIAKIQAMHLPIIIIDYLPPNKKDQAPALAASLERQGFIPWITNNALDKVYIKNVQPIPRKVLILYSNPKKQDFMFIPAAKYLGSVLEYLGYIPIYTDVANFKSSSAKLPKISNNYAGVVMWLDVQEPNLEFLLDWTKELIKKKIYVVFVGGFGVPPDAEYFNKLNLKISNFQDTSDSLKITKINPKYVGYDIQPPLMPYYFFPLKAPNSEVLFQVANNHKQTEDAIAITPWGGYALLPYVVQLLPDFHTMWILNPFEFLKKSLRLPDIPVPDISTESGRRLFFVHIDGDGFVNQAKWRNGGIAAQELYDRVLTKFPFPTSVSIVTGEIAPNGIHPKQSAQLMQVARKIFALPWVEVASHSFSHPFNWQPHKKYYEKLKNEGAYALEIPNYSMDLSTEIIGSINFINKNLVPPNKHANLFFWSGLANPSSEALDLITNHKLLAINGFSNTITDRTKDSVANVRPLSAKIGNNRQVFASFPMDFEFSHEFSGTFYEFQKVIDTAKATDKQHRLRPIDFYYHIYAASYPASLQAILKIYAWIQKQRVMHIYTSDYIKKVLDFYKIHIAKWHGGWLIDSDTNLREIRSPQSLGFPNLLASKNVIGYKKHKDSLYIHLGPNRLAMLKYQSTPPNEPYLVAANGWVVAYQRPSAQEFYFKLQGYLPLEFSIGNIKKCRLFANKEIKSLRQKSRYTTYSSREKSIEIRIAC